MKLRRMVKKIVALGTGVTMLGATLAGSMAAADLSNYPAPFIENGQFSGVLVIGNNAKAEDVIGVSDIATSLQFSATTTVGTTSSSANVIQGDVFKISASGDELNLLEPLSSVIQNVDRDDLDALSSGTLSNNKGTFTYDQYLTLGNSTVQFAVSDETGVTEDPALYLKAKQDGDSSTKNDGSELLIYKMSFPTALKSDIDSSNDLDDLDNKKLTILGKEYTITDTAFTAAGKLTMKLMGGALQATMSEGETQTFTINGKEYDVKVATIADTTSQVKFIVNTEATEVLTASDTYILSDGTEIGVREILANEAGDVTGDIVTFYLGAKKVEIEETAALTTAAGGKLTIGQNVISNAFVDFAGANTSTEVSLSTIEIAWQLDDNYFVPIGGKLTDHLTDQDDKDFADAFNLDMEFAGIEGQGALDVVEIKPSGSNNIRLKLKTKSGDEVSEEVFYKTSAGTTVNLGKDSSKTLSLAEGTGNQVSDEGYFVTESNKYSHLLQLKKVDSTNDEIEIQDVATGNTDTISYSGVSATLYKDGYAFTLGIDEANLRINLTAIAVDTSDGYADLWTEHEHKIQLTADGANGYVNITEGPSVTRDDSGITADRILTNISIVSSKLTPSVITTTSAIYNDEGASLKTPTLSLDSNDNKLEGMTRWGTFIEQDTSGDQDSLTLTIPEKETIASVYVTAGVTKTIQGSTEGGESVTIQKIEVGATKLASEVSDLEGQNAILVGGPCANMKVAEAVGNPADCTQGFEPGEGIIHLIEHDNGNVAMIVAGYSAADTRAAASVVADYGEYQDGSANGVLTGDTVLVTTATKTIVEGQDYWAEDLTVEEMIEEEVEEEVEEQLEE